MSKFLRASVVALLPSVANAFVVPSRGPKSLPALSSISMGTAPVTPAEAIRHPEVSASNSWCSVIAAGAAFGCMAAAVSRDSSSITMGVYNPWKRFKKVYAKPYQGTRYKALEKTIKGGSQQDSQLGYRIGGQPGHTASPHQWVEPIRWAIRFRRRIGTRKKMEGTCARPRLAVFRSKEHVHVNVIDDTIGNGVTLLTCTTKQKHNLEEIRKATGAEPKKEKTMSEAAAEILGKDVAKKCLEKNITQVCFDRGGFPYEGRVQALAEAARSAGLQF